MIHPAAIAFSAAELVEELPELYCPSPEYPKVAVPEPEFAVKYLLFRQAPPESDGIVPTLPLPVYVKLFPL